MNDTGGKISTVDFRVTGPADGSVSGNVELELPHFMVRLPPSEIASRIQDRVPHAIVAVGGDGKQLFLTGELKMFTVSPESGLPMEGCIPIHGGLRILWPQVVGPGGSLVVPSEVLISAARPLGITVTYGDNDQDQVGNPPEVHRRGG